MGNDRIPPVSRQFELRVEQTLAQISEMEAGKMQKKHRYTVIVAAALLLAAATAALAASGGYIMKLFGTERQESGLTRQLSTAVQPFAGREFSGEFVRITPGELLLTEDTFAATWTVENLTDEFLWIDAPVGFELNGESLFVLGAGSGMQDFEYYIDPGEVIESGVRTNLSGGAPEGESEFRLSLSVYKSKSGEKKMLDEHGVVLDENYNDLELLEEAGLTAPVFRADVGARSALPEGRALSFEFEDYTLVVEKAQLSPALLTLRYKRIYPNAAALERSPLADYHVTDLKGSDAWWYACAGSLSGDEDAEQPDGTLVYEEEMEYSITAQPAAIRLRPGYAGNDAKSDAESVELFFDGE